MDSDESHEAYAARVREALRVAITDGKPAAALASAAGVTSAALYDFIAEGSTVRPYRRTLASYERVLTSLDESGPSPLPGNGGDGDGGIVPVPATTLAYWRGRFDTMAEWAHALDAMMQQQREQFARFTQGVSDFRESGVLSAPPRLAHTADEAEAIVQELREAKARAAGVANGATPASVPAAARKA